MFGSWFVVRGSRFKSAGTANLNLELRTEPEHELRNKNPEV
jgi:hypothetical protein